MRSQRHGLPWWLGGKESPANAGVGVQSLVWEDPTGRGATKPMLMTTEPVH